MLPSLKFRRLRGDLIQLYKLAHNKYNVDHQHFFTFSPVTSTRGAKLKIFVDRCNSGIRQNSSVIRTVKYWNNLTDKAKTSETTNSFKNAIDTELRSIMYEYDE